MHIKLFRKRRYYKTLAERRERIIETGLKCLLLLLWPTPASIIASCLWYFGFYKHQWYFSERMEGIVTAAWIPTFGLLYALMAAVVINTVWTEYKTMRHAVKTGNLEEFMNLRDEDVSPLVHALMAILSLAVLTSFMSLNYPSVKAGFLLISTTSYVFGLIFMVVREIDDPCDGLWFIRHLPDEWIQLDPREWRAQQREKMAGKYSSQSTMKWIVATY